MDMLNFAFAGILLQPNRDLNATQLHWKPVIFYSRKFQRPKIKYHIYDKKLLAIINCFEQWQYYFEHTSYTTYILSNHYNLYYFMTTKELTF